MWDELKENKKNIVLYGMGDGAVKLLNIIEKMGLRCIGVFASDDFVRHQTFMGFTVKRLSEIEEECRDFVILSAFATRLPEVMDNFKKISLSHKLYIPDINVSGDYFELFDRAFVNTFGDRLEGAYSALDDYGKSFFEALLSYKLSGSIDYIEGLEALRKDADLPYDREEITDFVDFGAYIGDTVLEAVGTYPRLERGTAVEPDPKTFKKLRANTEGLNIPITCHNALVWNENTTLSLRAGGAMNTIIEENVTDTDNMQKKKLLDVKAVRGDDVIVSKPSLIKMDVEGAEKKAIEGCKKTISTYSPILRVSIYHNHRDVFELYEKISAINSGYSYTLRQKCRYIPAWDVELIAFRKF